MRLTIERVRMLVLVTAVVLLAALGGFLVLGKRKNLFNRRDIPHRLGMNIQQEANGVTYTQAHGGHTLFKIHADKVVQLKAGNAILREVKIELYGADGKSVDRIEGHEFEYDEKKGTARADGPVEIWLERPGVAPAVAPKAGAELQAAEKNKGTPLASAAETLAKGQIHIRTSGLLFDQKSGVATTSQRLDFSADQGSGSAVGAHFDSQQGTLDLEHAVALELTRGSQPVQLHAGSASFTRDQQICRLTSATVAAGEQQATATEARIYFRDDGSTARLEASGGLTLSGSGGQLRAPTGRLEFDAHNQPRQGLIEGGVGLDSTSGNPGKGSRMHATAPTAELGFTPRGQLDQARLTGGVEMHSEEWSATGLAANRNHATRIWRSPAATLGFRTVNHNRTELARIDGTGGVVVTGDSRRGAAQPVNSRLAADQLSGNFGPDSTLSALDGSGHSRFEQSSPNGLRQQLAGDRLKVQFLAPAAAHAAARPGDETSAVQSAILDGHVTLFETPATRPGAAAQSPIRATSGHAVYEGMGEWLHLTQTPRIENGGLELAADKVDLSRSNGDAFAHGNVKASWTTQPGSSRQPGASNVSLGGDGPLHTIAAEAQLHQASGEATFRGEARLWQQSNSIAAPVIVLDRARRSLLAHGAGTAAPVRLVLLSAGGELPGMSTAARQTANSAPRAAPGRQPSVIRLRGADLKYSDLDRKAWLHGTATTQVAMETGAATALANEVELELSPAARGARNAPSEAQVERLIAHGRVQLNSQGRRGTGEQLVYTAATSEYVLTGSSTAPPQISDPARGLVRGEAIHFNSRDDSVRVEGRSQKTRTETTAPR